MAHKVSLKSLAMLGGLLTVVTSTNAGTAPSALVGQWAGDRLQLVIDAQGGRVESDCASGRFAGPVTASADGKFSLQGSFENHQPGPQRADPTTQTSARYSGELQGGVIKLSITPTGASVAQVYTLQSGARIKLLRCL
jgi:hypothetical protein